MTAETMQASLPKPVRATPTYCPPSASWIGSYIVDGFKIPYDKFEEGIAVTMLNTLENITGKKCTVLAIAGGRSSDIFPLRTAFRGLVTGIEDLFLTATVSLAGSAAVVEVLLENDPTGSPSNDEDRTKILFRADEVFDNLYDAFNNLYNNLVVKPSQQPAGPLPFYPDQNELLYQSVYGLVANGIDSAWILTLHEAIRQNLTDALINQDINAELESIERSETYPELGRELLFHVMALESGIRTDVELRTRLFHRAAAIKLVKVNELDPKRREEMDPGRDALFTSTVIDVITATLSRALIVVDQHDAAQPYTLDTIESWHSHVAVALPKRRREANKPAEPQQPAPQQSPAAESQPARPAARFCTHCGHPLGPNDVFCGACGTRVQS